MAYPTTIDTFTTHANSVDIIYAEHINDIQTAVVAIETELAISTNRPKFLAFNSATDADQTGNGATATVDFDTEVFDTGADFASDTFTAPVTGKYLLMASVLVTGITAAMTGGLITLVTSNRTYYGSDIGAGLGPSGITAYVFHVAAIADMDAADTAIVQVLLTAGAGDTADIYGHASILTTCFAGALLV